MLSSKLKRHIKHARDQIVGRATIGPRAYRTRGYLTFQLAVNADHEPHVAQTIAKLLQKRGGIFIDVGANIGQTFVTVLRADPDRAYVGFEPQVACCHFIQRFIDDNKLGARMQIYPVALSSENGFHPFFSDHGLDDRGSLVSDWRPAEGRHFVCARKGDEVLKELGVTGIAAIKIDVEGYEFPVLAGLRQTLEKMQPPLIFEMLPNFRERDRMILAEQARDRNRAAAENIQRLLSTAGYALFQIDRRSGRLLPITQFDLDDMTNYRGRDYVALGEADRDLIEALSA